MLPREYVLFVRLISLYGWLLVLPFASLNGVGEQDAPLSIPLSISGRIPQRQNGPEDQIMDDMPAQDEGVAQAVNNYSKGYNLFMKGAGILGGTIIRSSPSSDIVKMGCLSAVVGGFCVARVPSGERIDEGIRPKKKYALLRSVVNCLPCLCTTCGASSCAVGTTLVTTTYCSHYLDQKSAEDQQ